LILIAPICTQRDINELVVIVEASSSDELPDEARLIQMKLAISSLNMNAKEVFKRVTLLDDVLVLEASAKLIKESIICHCEVVNLNTEDDLSSFRESCECDERFIDAQATKFEALLCFR
jgi:hypothetical protein